MRLFIVIVTSLLFSACLGQTRRPDSFTTIPSVVSPTINVPSPSNSPTLIPTISDQQLLEQIESESDLNFEAQFKQLETELQ